MPDTLTKRQEELVQALRDIDAQIGHLTRRRSAIRLELETIYPNARLEALNRPAVKVGGVLLSVFNYQREGYTGRVTTNPTGARLLDAPHPPSNVADFVLLSLCRREGGADIERLLGLPQLEGLPKLRNALHRLVRDGYINTSFTVKGVSQ